MAHAPPGFTNYKYCCKTGCEVLNEIPAFLQAKTCPIFPYRTNVFETAKLSSGPQKIELSTFFGNPRRMMVCIK
jgi:hypothetical protein